MNAPRTNSRRKLGRAMPCPGCGYDLRGTLELPGHDGNGETSGGGARRCSECGLEVKGRVGGVKLPWVRRRQLGALRAYLQTLWIVLWRPRLLAGAAEGPMEAGSARQFERVSLMIAVIVSALAIKVALLGEGSTRMIFPGPAMVWWVLPLLALTDSLWGIVPAILGMWIWTKLCMAAYRGVVWMGGRGTLERARQARMAHYASAVLMVTTILCCASWALAVSGSKITAHTASAPWIGAAYLLLVGFAFLFYVSGTSGLIKRTGRWRGWRGMLLTIFPWLAFALWVVIMAVAHWVAGYIVVGIRSMML